MKNIIKKIICIMIAVIMMFSVCSAAFAAGDVTPVIVVSGLGSFPLSLLDENGEIDEDAQVFPPTSDGIVKVVGKAIIPLAKALKEGDWNLFADGTFESIYADLFDAISCDEEGNSLYSVGTNFFDGNVGSYPETFIDTDKTDDEIGMIRGIAEEIGAENVFFFCYDWRLSPLLHADELADYIKAVKEETGASKVTLVPASMGGTVVNSYLYKYGSDAIDRIIYCEVASKGLEMVGELFSKNIEVSTDMVFEKLFNMEKGDIAVQALIGALYTGVEHIPGAEKYIDTFLKNFVDALGDRAYNEILIKSFANMTGLWAFCPDSYFEADKEIMFGKDANKKFIDEIDEYHYNVQVKSEDLMSEAIANGVQVYIIAAYGYMSTPLTGKAWLQCDNLVETQNESFGATCANYGENFGKNYEALGTVCADKSHNHVSTDAIIDASTCAFPEQTWFIKNNRHIGLDYGTDCQKLLVTFINAEEQLTVHSLEEYPQFVSLNLKTGKFSSLTGSKIKLDIFDRHSNIFLRLFAFIVGIVDLFKDLLNL